MNRIVRLCVLALGLLIPSSAWGLSSPTALYPTDGAAFQQVPWMEWTAISGADHYLFQIAADPGFQSPVLFGGDQSVETRNTFASLTMALPNNYYWWRVKAVTKAGATSVWSDPSSFRVNWLGQAQPQSPGDGDTLTYPTPATMTWSPVTGAAKYEFKLASDSDMSSLDGGAVTPVITDATSYTVVAGLTPSEDYYWVVTPIDGDGNRGTTSVPSRFTWQWPSSTTLTYSDLATDPLDVDPHFSWDPVPGAASYEIEINSDELFAPGSRFLDDTTVATEYSPVKVLLNNNYYWRVRAIDGGGHFGQWNYWNSNAYFTKSFDAPGVGQSSIQNLRMADYRGDPGTDLAGDLSDGYQTDSPIVTWDPVVGASAYEVEVRWWDGVACTDSDNTQYWDDLVATNSWTPLGPNPLSQPWPNHGRSLSYEVPQLVAGHQYCVRVRAYSDDGQDQHGTLQHVFGDWTYLDNGAAGSSPDWSLSFDFVGYPDDTCTQSCSASYPQASDYALPQTGVTEPRNPYFTWNPTPGAKSYFVLVSRDPTFTTLVDYAFVRGPAYAPRYRTSPTTYADETTSYYWAVLPAPNTNGVDVLINPLSASPETFEKVSQPPGQEEPTVGQVFEGKPSFQWDPVEGAKDYTLSVATDPGFSNVIETVTTDALSYTSVLSYPADTDLYWRVWANDWLDVGLTKSITRSFQVTLPTPSVAGNVASSESVPTWHWSSTDGAVSYDFQIQSPQGTITSSKGWRSTATTFLKLDGTGVWYWRVRANFPKLQAGQVVNGPWSAWTAFTNRMSAPSGANVKVASGGGVVLRWTPKMGAAKYQVEVSAHQDFTGPRVERVKVTNPEYAPLLKALGYAAGGNFYWRVAAVDETGNVGETTSAHLLPLPYAMVLRVKGLLTHGKKTKLTITVTDKSGRNLKGVVVTISGLGVKKRVKTKSNGTATITIKPKKTGKLPFVATRSGYWMTEYDASVR
jgi:hypothetical protein